MTDPSTYRGTLTGFVTHQAAKSGTTWLTATITTPDLKAEALFEPHAFRAFRLVLADRIDAELTGPVTVLPDGSAQIRVDAGRIGDVEWQAPGPDSQAEIDKFVEEYLATSPIS